MSNSVQPHRRQTTRLLCPWDSPGKNTGVGCHFLFQWHAGMLSHFSRVRLGATPWTAAHHTSLSPEFSRQEYWSGLPFPSPIKQYIWTNIYRHTTIFKIQNISITLKSSLPVPLPSVLIPGSNSWLLLICSLSLLVWLF